MTNYSKDTADLIERMCRNVERKSFTLSKSKASESILKTYDLFNLSRPKNVVWLKDIFDPSFEWSAGSAWSAWSAGSAWSAWSAWSAGSAWSAWSAGSAWSAWSAGSAWSAWSARSAGSARSARSAGSAWWTALDEEFYYFVFEYEYCKNPDADKLPNENDKKYLEYSELLMQAIEYGAGYRVEWENTLYIVPTPLILIDGQNRFHSEEAPAIRWKGGKEFYYLFGENFEKALWSKIVSKKITAAEVMKISDSDKRTIAMSLLSPKEMLKQLKAKLMHTGIKGNKLYESENFMSTGETEYFLVMKDSSTPRQFIQGIPRDIGRKGNADLATASAFVNERGKSISLKQYLSIKEEA